LQTQQAPEHRGIPPKMAVNPDDNETKFQLQSKKSGQLEQV
jgi:hypothetical protein